MDDGVWDVLQLDLAFGEASLRPAQSLASGLRIAPPDLARAWTIMWLWADMHTQAKDPYDAALLTTVADRRRLAPGVGRLRLGPAGG